MRRYALRDDQWDRIKDSLPGREGHMGGTAADNRLFVEAVLFRFRAGIPWRDLPERFGDWKIVYQRFNRWAKSGVFERIFRLLASDHDNEYMMIDATIVRAHQHSAGAQKKTVRKPAARGTRRRFSLMHHLHRVLSSAPVWKIHSHEPSRLDICANHRFGHSSPPGSGDKKLVLQCQVADPPIRQAEHATVSSLG